MSGHIIQVFDPRVHAAGCGIQDMFLINHDSNMTLEKDEFSAGGRSVFIGRFTYMNLVFCITRASDSCGLQCYLHKP